MVNKDGELMMRGFSPDRLAEVMRVQGRQVNWLAEQTEYDPSTVSRFLNRTYPITEKFAERAARALQIPVDWLRDPETNEVLA